MPEIEVVEENGIYMCFCTIGNNAVIVEDTNRQKAIARACKQAKQYGEAKEIKQIPNLRLL